MSVVLLAGTTLETGAQLTPQAQLQGYCAQGSHRPSGVLVALVLDRVLQALVFGVWGGPGQLQLIVAHVADGQVDRCRWFHCKGQVMPSEEGWPHACPSGPAASWEPTGEF